MTGTAAYVSGPTPPLYHHEWSVHLEATTGTVTFTPGYGSALSWSSTFVPDAQQVVSACRALRDRRDEGAVLGRGGVRLPAPAGGAAPLTAGPMSRARWPGPPRMTTDCHVSISLDGYLAGPDQSLDAPLGVGGARVHGWHFEAEGSGIAADEAALADLLRPRGAYV